jgi:hypothetical protein
MNTKDIGEASEAKILSELKSLGLTVLTPFGDNAKYDMVYDHNGKFNRVQVKTGRKKDTGVIQFKTQTTGHNVSDGVYHKGYTDTEIDQFAVHCPETDSCYLIDVNDAPSTAMSLRTEPTNNCQTKGVNMAEDFELKQNIK